MPDKFTHVTKTGLGSRLGKSFGGVVLGLALFFASFVLLFWNEGRTDMSNIAKNAVEISGSEVSSEYNEKLVAITDKLVSDEKIGDDYLKQANYIALKREVEMYAWDEKVEEETTTQTGGSETTKTTYEYIKEWNSNPADSANFVHPNEHYNPELYLESLDNKVKKAKIGVYKIDMDSINLPSYEEIELTEDMVILKDPEQVFLEPDWDYESEVLQDDYIFIGIGTLQNPEIGDIRISYSAIDSGFSGTAFGKLSGDELLPYVENGDTLYRILSGTKDEAVSTMHTEYVMMMWILRLVGFIMMWMGLTMLFTPLTTLADVIPLLGKLGKTLVSIIAFIVSLVLTLITIVISIIIHNIILVLIISGVLTAIVAIIIVMILKKSKNNSEIKNENS